MDATVVKSQLAFDPFDAPKVARRRPCPTGCGGCLDADRINERIVIWACRQCRWQETFEKPLKVDRQQYPRTPMPKRATCRIEACPQPRVPKFGNLCAWHERQFQVSEYGSREQFARDSNLGKVNGLAAAPKERSIDHGASHDTGDDGQGGTGGRRQTQRAGDKDVPPAPVDQQARLIDLELPRPMKRLRALIGPAGLLMVFDEDGRVVPGLEYST